MKHPHCSIPNCNKEARFKNTFETDGQKKWGALCARHDNFFGRKNLLASGMTNDQAIAAERELKEGDALDHPYGFLPISAVSSVSQSQTPNDPAVLELLKSLEKRGKRR